MKGIVYSDVTHGKVYSLLTSYEEGECILSRLVKILPYKEIDDRTGKVKEGIVLGRVVNYLRINEHMTNEPLLKIMYDRPEVRELIQRDDAKFHHIVLEIETIGAFSYEGERLTLRAPIIPGAMVDDFTEEDFYNIFKTNKDKFVYLGRFYGTNVPQPLILKPLTNDAAHILVVGQTGSGKSTLVKMLMSLYAKQFRHMNFIVFDTVGEFTLAFTREDPLLKCNFSEVFVSYGRETPVVLRIGENLVFDRWEVLEFLMDELRILRHTGIPQSSISNMRQGVEFIVNWLDRKRYALKDLYEKADEIFRELFTEPTLEEFASAVYKDKTRKEEYKAKLFNQDGTPSYGLEIFKLKLKKIFSLFDTSNNRMTVNSMAYRLLEGGKTFIIDLSSDISLSLDEISRQDINMQAMRKLMLKELVDAVRRVGNTIYNEGGSLDTMIILEEAHNWAPRRITDETENDYTSQLSNALVNAYKETRKFGISWLAISTRLTSLRQEIFEHSRIKLIGMGLQSGNDYDILREEFGNNFMVTYSTFPDPTDPLIKTNRVCFMVAGPITVISTKPEAVEIFSPDEFLDRNDIKENLLPF
jgi:energy-coupling factor transporter ATP-binding protein EcfA2